MNRVYKKIISFIMLLTVILTGLTTVRAEELAEVFAIDNQNVYQGMDKSYSEGYQPRVSNNTALVVLPLVCSAENGVGSITAAVNLGTAEMNPFVYKNYEKSFDFQGMATLDGKKSINGYLVYFELELSANHYNGSYPVVIDVKGRDEKGVSFSQEFTVYVVITDGLDLNAEEPTTEEMVTTEEAPVFQPKLMVKESKASKPVINAGDEFTIDITIKNTSESQGIKNLTVVSSTGDSGLKLLDESDSIYVKSIGAGEEYIVSYKYKAASTMAAGSYTITLAMDYADYEGRTYTAAGNAIVEVMQPVNVEFDKLNIVESAEIATKITAGIQVMNLGASKICNVRATIECDGMKPVGTIYIGDIEAKATGTADTEITITSLSNSANGTGETEGTVTYIYEDVEGNEYTNKEEFRFSVTALSKRAVEEKKDDSFQWWIIMTIVITILAGFGFTEQARRKRERRKNN